MLAAIASATLNGALGRPVSVEVHVSNGLPGFTIVGLPDAAVREARDRVRAAVLSSGLSWPLRRVTVNLAPSGVRKGGAGLDLPIAVGLLVATGEISPTPTEGLAFCGELGLNGALRHVPGMIALADATAPFGLVVPLCDVREAALVRGEQAHGVATLAELARVLRGQSAWPPPPPAPPENDAAPVPDLADVRGQALGRRALEVAAAGSHHLLMIGPPGSGKTMLAERLPGLLPPLSPDEALTVTRVHSAAGGPLPAGALVGRAPFRAPHHQASVVSLVGGGSWSLRPGEASLATHGVLFLDELGEFPVPALEALRQPLEEGVIRVSRAGGTVTFPAAFLLVAAMNPCPCGEGVYLGACACTAAARARYRRRLSAPLLDRFDLAVPLSRPDPVQLLSSQPAEGTADVAARVAAARARADDRTRASSPVPPLKDEAAALLASKLHAGELSARGPRQGDEGRAHRRRFERRGRRVLRARQRGAVAALSPGGGAGVTDPPEEAYAIALASVGGLGPATLRTMLSEDLPSVAWSRHSDSLRGSSSDRSVAAIASTWEAHARLGISVLLGANPAYPRRLRADPQSPPILFCLGDPNVLEGAPSVAIVGTRSPTRYGLGVAAQLGAELSAAGVSVVSGLALGIDGAAHEGACAAGAPPVGVVAGGLDDPYPQRHARLWARVAERGVIVSESPAGVGTEKWRFPTRNRLLAALSDVVVVVESRPGGGSRHTVDAALTRGVLVGAVPGSIRSPTSEGTNALLAEGAIPVCGVADVLMALSLCGAMPVTPPASLDRSAPPRPPKGTAERLIHDVLTDEPTLVDSLAELSGLDLSTACGALERLTSGGLAQGDGGWWVRA